MGLYLCPEAQLVHWQPSCFSPGSFPHFLLPTALFQALSQIGALFFLPGTLSWQYLSVWLIIIPILPLMPFLPKGIPWSSSKGNHPTVATLSPSYFLQIINHCLYYLIYSFVYCLSFLEEVISSLVVLVSSAARAVPGMCKALNQYLWMSNWTPLWRPKGITLCQHMPPPDRDGGVGQQDERWGNQNTISEPGKLGHFLNI